MPGVTTAYQTGVHGSRPANGAGCVLYSCTTHSLVYRDDGTSWTTFMTLGTAGALTDPMTTRGDVIVRNSSNTTARLGIGAAGKFLSSDGTDIAYGQGPLTTTGDLLIGASGGTPTRLAAGATSGHVLTSNGSAAAPSWQAAAGGGGLTQAYIGYDSIGASYESTTIDRILMKKVTIATACLLTDIELYLQHTSDSVDSTPVVGVWEDNSGTPGKLRFDSGNWVGDSMHLSGTSGAPTTPRWIGFPCGYWLTVADWWIGFMVSDQSGTLQIAYDSGSDRYMTSGGHWFADGTYYSQTDSTRKYSIRGNTIR